MFAALPLLLASWAAAAPDVPVPVDENMTRLLREFDVDGDSRITVDDHPAGSFELVDRRGGRRQVTGAYPLSVLLQELGLARDQGRTSAVVSSATLAENPVDRTHRMIRDLFWDSLTRRIDEGGLARVLDDPKSASADGLKRLYVPPEDVEALAYFR